MNYLYYQNRKRIVGHHLDPNHRKMHKEYLKKTSLSRIVPSKHYFWSEKLRATPARTKILDLIKGSPHPLSIEEICEKIADGDKKNGCDSKMHLATIYRTLNSLIKMNIIWKIYPRTIRTRKHALYEIRPFK
jgi:hypothetical protein